MKLLDYRLTGFVTGMMYFNEALYYWALVNGEPHGPISF